MLLHPRMRGSEGLELLKLLLRECLLTEPVTVEGDEHDVSLDVVGVRLDGLAKQLLGGAMVPLGQPVERPEMTSASGVGTTRRGLRGDTVRRCGWVRERVLS